MRVWTCPSAVGSSGGLGSGHTQEHVSPSNGDVCVSLLVSDDRHMGTHKHVSQLSGGVCAVLPVSDHLQYEVRLPGDVLQLDQNNISSYVSGEDRGILVSERVRKHVSPFSGGVCVPLPVSFQFQDGVKGSDDNLSMDQSNISSGSFSKESVFAYPEQLWRGSTFAGLEPE